MSRKKLLEFGNDILFWSSVTLEQQLAAIDVHYYIFAVKDINQLLGKHFPDAKVTNLQTVARNACANPPRTINTGAWGGRLLIDHSAPPELKRYVASGGTICKLFADANYFSIDNFRTAVNIWKVQEITTPLLQVEGRTKDSSWVRAAGSFRRDLSRIHGIEGMHTTTAVGAATSGKKRGTLGTRPSDPMQGTYDSEELDDFVIPYFKQKMADIVQTEAGVQMETATAHSGIDDKVIIVVRLAGSGKQTVATDWDKGGVKLDRAITKAREEILDQIEATYGSGSKILEASPSAQKRISRMAVETVAKKISGKATLKPRTKVKLKEPKVKKGKKGTKVTVKSKKKPTRLKKGNLIVKGKKGKRRPSRQESPIGLVALLNKSLPAQVQKNMAPIRGSFPRRLTYRTGRFASSAEVVNVAPYPNMVEISYTYEKDPYGVFERGSGDPRATGPARDPRQIIGESIREVAQSIMGTRFGIVRTKRV